ncbi:hypothetical protein GCM10022397_14900 [Flavivirga jejuensis]
MGSTANYIREMTPHESGSYQYANIHISQLRKLQKKYNRSYQTTMHHRKTGANHDHSEAMWRDLYNLGRSFIKLAPDSKQKIIVPESMNGIKYAFNAIKRKGKSLVSEIGSSNSLKNVSKESWNEVIKLTQKLLSEDSKFRSLYYFPKYGYGNSSKKFTHNLSVQYSGIPLALDLTDGKFSIKGTARIGPWKFTSKVGYQKTSSNLGIKILKIVHSDGRIFLYDVRKTSLSFYFEKVYVDINKDIITLNVI